MNKDYYCEECGGLFWIDCNGIANHIDEKNFDIDYDKDEDHVPYEYEVDDDKELHNLNYLL
jgi:hypothetical protein